MHKILILGGSGLVGRAIINEMNKYNQYIILKRDKFQFVGVEVI